MVIHVIDDDEAVRESLEALLVVTGFDVKTYSCAEEYLAVSDPSDGCLIVDVHMPGMSGLDLLQDLSIREPGIPVLVLTASRETRLMEQALELGAAAFLTKPVPGATLVAALRAAGLRYGSSPTRAVPHKGFSRL